VSSSLVLGSLQLTNSSNQNKKLLISQITRNDGSEYHWGRPFGFLFSKAWANGLVSESVRLLKQGAGSEGSWLWNQRLAAVLIFKRELLEKGYNWQAARIDNWIHRLQPRRADLQREAGRAP